MNTMNIYIYSCMDIHQEYNITLTTPKLYTNITFDLWPQHFSYSIRRNWYLQNDVYLRNHP